jgi:hypothetical protein
MKKSKNVDDLLAAIQRKAPNPDHEARGEPEQSDAHRAVVPVAEIRPKRSRVGKAVQFWMHEEDRRILRELSAWLASPGVRPSDSLVIRTALRVAKTGSELLQAYHEAAQLDGRLKQNVEMSQLDRS